MKNAPVAQLDRVRGYEPRDRGFESLQAYHIKNGEEKSLFIGIFPFYNHLLLMQFRRYSESEPLLYF